MKGHKTSLNKFKKIEIISSIFSNHMRLKLETTLKEKTQTFKFIDTAQHVLNNEWIKNEIEGEIKKSLETNENELTIIQTYKTQ